MRLIRSGRLALAATLALLIPSAIQAQAIPESDDGAKEEPSSQASDEPRNVDLVDTDQEEEEDDADAEEQRVFRRRLDDSCRGVVCAESTCEMVGTTERTTQRHYLIRALDSRVR